MARQRAKRNPKALRAWLHDAASQQQIEDAAQMMVGNLVPDIFQKVDQFAQVDPHSPATLISQVPDPLIAPRLAKAIQDEIERQVSQVAANARTEQWSWSAIAEALGMQPTTDPRNLYPDIDQALEGHQGHQ